MLLATLRRVREIGPRSNIYCLFTFELLSPTPFACFLRSGFALSLRMLCFWSPEWVLPFNREYTRRFRYLLKPICSVCPLKWLLQLAVHFCFKFSFGFKHASPDLIRSFAFIMLLCILDIMLFYYTLTSDYYTRNMGGVLSRVNSSQNSPNGIKALA